MAERTSFVIKRDQVKKIVLPIIVLTVSLLYSLVFAAGIAAGYLICRLFCLIFVNSGRIRSIFINYGKWRIHLHHWITGLILLAGVWIIDFLYLPAFFAGFICGVILQDIYDYKDWYKVFLKK